MNKGKVVERRSESPDTSTSSGSWDYGALLDRDCGTTTSAVAGG